MVRVDVKGVAAVCAVSAPVFFRLKKGNKTIPRREKHAKAVYDVLKKFAPELLKAKPRKRAKSTNS